MTTVPSRSSASSVMVISKVFLPEAEISCVWKPRQEISRTASSGTLRVKEPSRSVMVPTVVPFTITPTPARPSPLESYTVPLISLSWAKAAAADIKTAKHRNRTFFISGYWFISVFWLLQRYSEGVRRAFQTLLKTYPNLQKMLIFAFTSTDNQNETYT